MQLTSRLLPSLSDQVFSWRTFQCVNPTLFTTFDGKPFRFYLNFDEFAYSKEPVETIINTRMVIEVNGGIVAKTFLEMIEDEYCIPILIRSRSASKGIVAKFSLWNQRDLFDYTFVTHSLENRRLMDLNDYRLEGYCCNEYDANSIMNQGQQWQNAFQEFESKGLHGPLCEGILKLDAFYFGVKSLDNDWFDVDVSLIGLTRFDFHDEHSHNMDFTNDPDIQVDEAVHVTFNESTEADVVPDTFTSKTDQSDVIKSEIQKPKKRRPMYKYIRGDIMRAVYIVGKKSDVLTLGNREDLWKEVCKHVLNERHLLKKPAFEHGIDFNQLELKWVGVQKHFYSFLLKNAAEYYVMGSEEFKFFQRWNKK